MTTKEIGKQLASPIKYWTTYIFILWKVSYKSQTETVQLFAGQNNYLNHSSKADIDTLCSWYAVSFSMLFA